MPSLVDLQTNSEFKARDLLEKAEMLLEDPALEAQANFLIPDTPYPAQEIQERLLIRGDGKWYFYERLIKDLQKQFLREALLMPTIPDFVLTKKKYDLTKRI